MAQFEYKVVPAPKKGLKARGVKGTEAQFANALATVMNEAAAEGWEYQRTDSLPCEERQGLTGRVTVFQNMLIFRRAVTVAAEAAEPPVALPPPSAEEVRAAAAEDTPALAVPVGTPAVTAPAPVVAREVAAPEGATVIAPDPRIAATLRLNDAQKAAASAPPLAATSPRVAAE